MEPFKIIADTSKIDLQDITDWALFRESDSEVSNYSAYTYWSVNYTSEECYGRIRTKIRVSILPQSWVRSNFKTQQLLTHEN